MRMFLVLFSLILAPMLALPATAQEQALQEQGEQPLAGDPHAALIDSIQANADIDAIMANVLAETDRQFRAQPMFAALEEQSPGLIREVVKAMAPILRTYQERVRIKYEPQMIDEARAVFTAGEARALADFYSSDIGVRFLQVLSQNFSVGAVLEGAVDPTSDYKVTRDEIQRDLQTTVAQTMGALSADEMREVNEALRGVEGIAKMEAFSERTANVQMMIENEPPNAVEQAAIDAAIMQIFNARFPDMAQ